MELLSNCCGARVYGERDGVGNCCECGDGCGVEAIYERPDFQKIALEKVKSVRKEIISKLSEQKQ